MSFLSKKPKKGDEGQRAAEFFNEICKRFGNESNLFRFRSATKQEPPPEETSAEKVEKVLKIQTERSLTDDMLAAFSMLEEKLKNELNDLTVDNRILEERLLQVTYDNENRMKVLENLKSANERLLKENAVFFNDSLRHRYLKLKTSELNSTRNHLLGMLENKRKKTLDLQSQLDKLMEEHQGLAKEREKAGLNAAHLSSKVTDLYSRCKALDIVREEQIQRRILISRFRQRDGPIRVYLLTRGTFSTSCVSFLSLKKVAIQGHKTKRQKKTKPLIFQFHQVFKPSDDIQYLYEDIKLQAIHALDGFNSAFMTYGQTGTGKTRTFFGTEPESGLIHCVLLELLNDSLNRKTWSYSITCSALEAHVSGAYDIFSKDPDPISIVDDGLKLKMGSSIAELDLKVPDDITVILEKIKEGRTVGSSTRVSQGSTRKHLVIVVRVQGCDKANKSEVIDGTLLLVDLAGFEDVNQLVNYPRDLVNEAFASNRSLNALAEVLAAVRKRKTNIPFHRSPLTMLLKPCLMGESHFCIILHSLTQFEEHHSIVKTMRFGMNAVPINKCQRGRRVEWKV